jgi:hypothetical protein
LLFLNTCFSGGNDGQMQLRDVWASSDGGLTWTQVCAVAQWEGRQGQACVELSGYVFLMGGNGNGGSTRFNDIWKSKDCGKLLHVIGLMSHKNNVSCQRIGLW